ncbi:O-methyltransferase [Sphingopyxis solisilvae]|uniref:O-methyltransferase n=1 Tax=Sphingopyxis solisilvae TaxID=1886788 RepID=UPI001892CB05|nr:O-methyltransferase [Sphingopyxis solisilvae]
MTGSFDKIDYSLRPAKYAERRMLRDVFRRVAPFAPPETYTYIGFGSVWFADFVLFHRALGVRDMISIECKAKAFDRIKDNAPFRIDLELGRSEKVLTRLDLTKRAFLWLDYDDAIDANMLLDLRTVSAKAQSGTLLAVTVRAQRARQADQAEDDADGTGLSALDRFRTAFNRARVPAVIEEEDLYGRPFAKVSRDMLRGEIETALIARNRKATEDWRFETVCSFEYADGVLMTTIVGMFLKEEDRATFEQCGFENLPFASAEKAAFKIEVPLITPKEFKLLEAQLPLKSTAALETGTIPNAQAANFERLYRYLPSYAVLES